MAVPPALCVDDPAAPRPHRLTRPGGGPSGAGNGLVSPGGGLACELTPAGRCRLDRNPRPELHDSMRISLPADQSRFLAACSWFSLRSLRR
jgi:hypothetical protein